MKSEPRTVNELFETAVRYVVPLYQRPYVWNEKDQWQPLWDDLVSLVDNLGVRTGHYVDHFMGAIVLQHETPIPGEIPEFTVIDGQQRLTTLQLLLSAAARVARTRGFEQDAEILVDLTHNDPKRATGERAFKVWPTNQNRAAFRAALDAASDGHAPDDHHNTIQEAHAFFEAAINTWLDDPDIQDKAAAMTRLRAALTDQVRIVSITLEQPDNPQVIFETLNARGTPLQALDLVKNAVFHEAQRKGIPTDELYEEVWKPELDEVYWRRDRRQGRLTRAAGDLFLMHWLAMREGEIVNASRLFQAFRNGELGKNPRQRDRATHTNTVPRLPYLPVV